MIEEIIKEKTSADHLLYVSLKYTKTCDVMLNLLARWKTMMERSYNFIIEKAIEEGKIPAEPESPKQRIEFIRKYFANSEPIQESVPLYIFFKRVPELPKTREGEFRKNVNLKVQKTPTKQIEINLEKLSEYSEILERFISEVKHLLSK